MYSSQQVVLSGQHFLQVCHDISNHGPQCRAEVHVSRVLDAHGVAFTVVEPKVTAVCHVEAGTWMTQGQNDAQRASQNMLENLKLQLWKQFWTQSFAAVKKHRHCVWFIPLEYFSLWLVTAVICNLCPCNLKLTKTTKGKESALSLSLHSNFISTSCLSY